MRQVIIPLYKGENQKSIFFFYVEIAMVKKN